VKNNFQVKPLNLINLKIFLVQMNLPSYYLIIYRTINKKNSQGKKIINLVKIIKIKLILKTITIVLKMKNLIKSKHIRWFQRHHKRIINLVKIKFKEK
jgi:hypothetical protein